ncbi:MAG: FecCD family ABC transporter permease [Phycisphaerae bacterium]
MHSRGNALRLVGLAPLVVLIVLASAMLGPSRIGLDDIFGSGGGSNAFWLHRFPRTLLAALTGAGLAVGGVVFQALFRNPLATPYTLGIDSGAALGAAIGFLLNFGGYWLGVPRLTLLALAGATIATAAVLLIAGRHSTRDLTRLLLAGVCVAYLSSAGLMLTAILAGRGITQEIAVWMMGSLAVLSPTASMYVGVALAVVLTFALASHRALDLLAQSDQLAAARGVDVGRTIWISLALVSVLTAVIVGHCGPIGFVGLIVPHLARLTVGPRSLAQLLASALIGAAFLAVCDAISRSVSIYDPPVGILTNILGAMFFFYLLASRTRAT